MPHPSTRTPTPENLKFTILIDVDTNNSFVIITIYSILWSMTKIKEYFWRNNAFSLYIYIPDLCDHALAPTPGIHGNFKKKLSTPPWSPLLYTLFSWSMFRGRKEDLN